MKYDKRSIEKRNFIKINISNIIKMFIFILFIVIVYNIFLVFVSDSYENKTTDIFGYKGYIITTDSMSPTFSVGDVIIVKKANYNYLNKGDIITFRKDTEVITHRIVNKVETGYVTKGDNNNIEDMFIVTSDEILGLKVFKIPALGNIIKLINNSFYIFIILVIFITLYLHNRRKYNKKILRRKLKRLEDEKNKQD